MKTFDYTKHDEHSRRVTPAAAALISQALNHPGQVLEERSARQLAGNVDHSFSRLNVLPRLPVLPSSRDYPLAALTGLPISQPGEPLEQRARQTADNGWQPAARADPAALAGVRIHSGPQADASARAVAARAYTIGRDLVFANGEFAPHTSAGRKLLTHELAHVAQQGQTGRLALQRQETDPAKKEEKKDEASKAITEGITTVAEQAADIPKVKEKVIEPVKKEAEKKWSQLKGGEQAAAITFGAVTYGGTLTAMLASKDGRKILEGMNLVAPLTLIPYMPLSSFKFTPPGEGPGPGTWKFDTSFSGDQYLQLFTKPKGLPEMSLGVDMQWGFDPKTEKVSVLGGQAKLGLMPGVSLSGGTYNSPLAAPQIFPTAEGGWVESKKSIPGPAAGPERPEVRVMLTIDLLKLDKSILPKSIRGILGAF